MKKKLKIYSHHICFDNTMRYKENLYMKFVQRYEFLLVLKRTELKSKCWLKLKKKNFIYEFSLDVNFYRLWKEPDAWQSNDGSVRISVLAS